MATTQTRILSLLVLVLGLLNVGLLTALWLGQPSGLQPGHPAMGGPVAAYVVRELRFTPTQQEQYAVLRQAHHTAMRQMLPALAASREQLFAGLARPTPDVATHARQLDRIAALERRIDSLTYAHFAQVGRLATPAQLPRWQQLAPTLPHLLQQQRPPNRFGGPRGPHPPTEGPPPGPPE